MTPKEIGAELRRARQHKKWSQMLVAGKLNRARSSVTRYEHKTEELTLKSLTKVLDVLDLELVVRPKKKEPVQLSLDI